MDSLLTALTTLLPVMLILGIGVALRRAFGFPDAVFKGNSRLIFWVGLPALLFHKAATAQVEGAAVARVAGGVVLAAAAATLAAGLVGRLLRIPRNSIGAFVQCSFRSNLAFVGIPVIFYCLADRGWGDGQFALLALAPVIPVYNTLGTVLLLAGSDATRLDPHPIRTVLLRSFANPLLLACVGGGIWGAFALPMPKILGRSLETLGQMCVPLALLGIGASIRWNKLRGEHLSWALAAAAIKLLVSPAVVFLAARQLGLSGPTLLSTVVFTACPSAAMCYVTAEQLGGDAELSASAIALSTLLCIPVLAILLMVL